MQGISSQNKKSVNIGVSILVILLPAYHVILRDFADTSKKQFYENLQRHNFKWNIWTKHTLWQNAKKNGLKILSFLNAFPLQCDIVFLLVKLESFLYLLNLGLIIWLGFGQWDINKHELDTKRSLKSSCTLGLFSVAVRNLQARWRTRASLISAGNTCPVSHIAPQLWIEPNSTPMTL